MFSRLPLTHKFSLISGLSALLVLVITGCVLLSVNFKQLNEEFESRMLREVNIVAVNLGSAVLFDDWENARELIESLLTDGAVLRASLTDSKGRVRVVVDRPLPGETDSLPEHHRHVATVHVLDGDREIASLTVIASKSEVYDSLLSTMSLLMLLTLLALVVGVGVTVRAQHWTLEPLDDLTGLVKRVSRDADYALRAQPRYPDEIGALAEDINGMLEIIQRREEDLGELVAERTRELEMRNRDLRQEIRSREASEQALREIQSRFENAFDNAPIGMAIMDNDGRLIQRNHVLNDLLQTSADNVIVLEQILSGDAGVAVMADFLHLVQGRSGVFEREVECLTLSAKRLSCVLSVSAVVNGDGGVLYSVLQLQDVTEAVRLSKELEHQARHDALTGLANRRAFEAALLELNTALQEPGFVCSLALLDLDQFKVVNDVCGHAAGDALLVQIAEMLKQQVRDDDLVVRLGGDEFAVILRGCGRAAAFRTAEKVRKSLEETPFVWGTHSFRIGGSIGLVTLTEPLESIGDALRQADAACFSAKDMGRNTVYQANSEDERIAEKHGEMHWVGRINQALDLDHFMLYCQPIVPIRAGVHEGARYEVLLRLNDELTGRHIPPGAFMPTVERYDMGVRVDTWVVRHLITKLTAQPQRMLNGARFWVNLSGQSIGNAKFVQSLEQMLRESGLPPGQINFEVTETAVVRSLKSARDAIGMLKSMGCQFALDDFGSGLSSFGYLKNLPVDYIKIDGMFVRNIVRDEVDRIFVKSIIDIAREMNIRTVAEFVEDTEILDLLSELGVDFGQGYGLGRPQPMVLPALDLGPGLQLVRKI